MTGMCPPMCWPSVQGGPDLFFHRTALGGQRLEELREGQRVEYESGTDPRNPTRTRAENVRLIEG